MDTFSRKHRLRQLQLQKQQQQQLQLSEPHNYLTYDKENSQPQQFSQHLQHQFQHQSAAANGAAAMGGGGVGGGAATVTRKCIRQDSHHWPHETEAEDNEFKVVRVIGFPNQESISCETSRFPRNVGKVHTALKSTSKPVSISLVSRCHQATGGSTNDSLSQHSHSDSSGFSSSLYSTQVEIKHNHTPTTTTTNISGPANQSKLIDELDRLIMHVDSGASPGESYMSCIDHRQQDSTLVRSNERVNSSLCGDEFSSFIAVTAGEHPKALDSLVGDAKLRIDRCDNHYTTISETELSYDSGEDGKWSQLSDSKPSFQKSLGALLEEHVAKVQTLLRLASGDRDVSMVEAFGHSDIPVSEEFCIPIEFVAAERKPTTKRIIHELDIVDLDCNREADSRGEKSLRLRFEGSEVPFICPLGLQLDWSRSGGIESGKQVKLGPDLSSLKHSILQKLLLKHQEDPLNKSLVSKVSEHVNEFIDNYVEFHNNLKAHTTFSSDWHENWLFGSRGGSLEADGPVRAARPDEGEEEEAGEQGEIASKRARLSTGHHSQCDLLRYSTLILAGNGRRRGCSLRYLTDQLASVCSPDDLSKVDQFYEEQEEQVEELRLGKTNSLGLPDVCQLLLEDDWCSGEYDANLSTQIKQRTTRRLQVSYESSILNPANASGHLSFMAYGYFIKTPLLISPNTGLMKLAKLKQRTLARLDNLLRDPASRQLIQAPGNHRVRFSISVTSVELVNRLQVVQFCAQVAGFLPISVRWFRGSQEISHKSSSDCRSNETSSEWPVWFHANYDYQYKTEWGSWYRFRRSRDWILFEIGCPNEEQDYGVSYRCLVENYCSQDECNFTLKTRLLTHQSKTTLLDLNNNKRGQSNDALKEGEDSSKLASANKARAVLRTWSQRTLKPQARVLEEASMVELEQKNLQAAQVKSSLARHCLSESPLNEDRFGKDFPYHPENLLKRLRENMFSVSTNRKPAPHRPSHQLEDYTAAAATQLVQQQIHFEPLEEPQSATEECELEKCSTPPAANLCGSTQNAQTISNGKDAPKPQDRLSKITSHVKQQPHKDNQSSCMVNHEPSELKRNSNKSDFIPIASDNHDSREARASSYASNSGQTGLCRDETGSHADSNGNYKLKTCVKSLISKFNMA